MTQKQKSIAEIESTDELNTTIDNMHQHDDLTRMSTPDYIDPVAVFRDEIAEADDDLATTYVVVYKNQVIKLRPRANECACGNYDDYTKSRGTPAKQAQQERAAARCKHADDLHQVDLIEAPYVGAGNIDTEDENRTVRIKVDQDWVPSSDKIQQVGLVADGSGKCKYTNFENSGLDEELSFKKEYELENVRTNKFNGSHEIILTGYTSVRRIR